MNKDQFTLNTPWKFSIEPFKIAENLFYVGNTVVSSHLIETKDGLILLETGFPQTLYLLLESIRKLGFSPYDIKYILHTHAHYDHCGGTRALMELTGAKSFMGTEDIPFLSEKQELTGATECGAVFHEIFNVDYEINDGDIIKLGDTQIRCVHTPGHTPGCFSFFFTVNENNREYKVGLYGGPGLNTLTDEYLNRYGLPNNMRKKFLDSIQKLKRECVDISIAGHPFINNTFGKVKGITLSDNPFIDRDEWLTFLFDCEKKAAKMFGV